MKKQIHLYLFYTISIACIFISCNAPHSNPFDPDNDDNTLSVLNGIIKTVKIPRTPINDATVHWPNDEKITKTDAAGRFTFDDLPREDGYLYYEKEGFSPDSIYVKWDDSKTKNIEGYLNSNPKLNDLDLYSIVLNDYTKQTFNLEVIADISDEENDIDSVFVTNEYLTSKKHMLFNSNTKIYKTEFLNFTKIEEVIGKDFSIIVKDRNNKEFVIGSSILKRIIKQELNFKSPKNNEAVSSQPDLVWERFTPGFNFNYQIQVYTREIVPTLVWEAKDVSSDSISYKVNRSLSSSVNEYFWVIWAIDEFGNRTRSKQATFTVTNE